ncbi:MAG TPA: hypothetical protein VMU54_20855, partial [Planctomycetota bacterium]|nr:hypothetical protein [Planctomycetota bacterium]
MMLSCLLISLAAVPNDPPEIDLASALARRGWVDLAEELCSRIEKMPGASAVLAEVAAAHARQQPDTATALREFDLAIARLGVPKTFGERAIAGFLRVEKARRLAETPEAAKAWQAAEAFFAANLAELQKLPAGPAVEEAILDSRLEQAKAVAARARATLGDETLRKKLLDQAVGLFLDFQLDTGTRPIAFEAILEEGRARGDQNDHARAERCFRSVLALQKNG